MNSDEQLTAPAPAPRRVELTRVTVQINHRLTHELYETLRELNVGGYYVEQSRMVLLHERKRRSRMFVTTISLDDSPAERVSFCVGADHAARIAAVLSTRFRFHLGGRGTLRQEVVQSYVSSESSGASTGEATGDEGHTEGSGRTPAGLPGFRRGLTGITFILSSSTTGNLVAKTALELGVCVPYISLGVGTGVRDRLGLLRITIPADKEIVELVAPDHDAEGILNLIVQECKLDQPGRGFAYLYPVSEATLSPRLRIGRQEHAASVEQIIHAIDELRGETQWRTRYAAPTHRDRAVRLRRDQREISITCSENRTDDFVATAVRLGVGGATTARVRALGADTQTTPGAIVAQERTTMVVPEGLVGTIVQGLSADGLFAPESSGRIDVAEVRGAYSYPGR